MGTSYVEARRCEFISLVQRERSVVEYKVEFLRLSRCAQALVTVEYDKCVWFEDGL